MGVGGSALSAPVRLEEEHDCEPFSCGESSLDEWLKRRARKGDRQDSARTFVVCDGGTRVVGYYSLSNGSITRDTAPRKLQRNMPDPLPVLVLGRLAVDHEYQGAGIGQALLRDAMLRALRVSREVGFVAILVHALTDEVKEYYLRRGFLESPIEPLTLCLPLETIRRALVG